MPWKAYKPSKAVSKRFKITATGKVKRRCTLNSHRRSVRSAALKRRVRRPEIMFEGHGKNLRRFAGVSKLKPMQIAHERRLRDREGNRAGDPVDEQTHLHTGEQTGEQTGQNEPSVSSEAVVDAGQGSAPDRPASKETF